LGNHDFPSPQLGTEGKEIGSFKMLIEGWREEEIKEKWESARFKFPLFPFLREKKGEKGGGREKANLTDRVLYNP